MEEWDNLPEKKMKRPPIKKIWDRLTGFDYGIVKSLRDELDENDNCFIPPGVRGRRTLKLEDAIDGLYEFLVSLVDECKIKGYLTLAIIRRKIYEKYGKHCSQKCMRKCLGRLGFRYDRRVEAWVNARESQPVQRQLYEFVDWVHRNSVMDQPPLYNFVNNFAFFDESHIYTEEFRRMSWFNDGNRLVQLMRSGARINMFDGLITGCSISDAATLRVHWNSRKKVAEHFPPKLLDDPEYEGFHGKYVNCDKVLEYCKTYLFPRMVECECSIVYVDNASTHKAFVDDLRGRDVGYLIAFTSEALQESGMEEKMKAFYDGMEEKNDTETRKYIMQFLRDTDLRKRRLVEEGKKFGIQVRFLPTGWFECDPVEKIWRRLKPKYRDYKSHYPDLNWKVRLDLAYHAVDDEYIAKIVSEMIKWCRGKREEMSASGWKLDANGHGIQGILAKGKGKGKGKGGVMVIPVGQEDDEGADPDDSDAPDDHDAPDVNDDHELHDPHDVGSEADDDDDLI